MSINSTCKKCHFFDKKSQTLSFNSYLHLSPAPCLEKQTISNYPLSFQSNRQLTCTPPFFVSITTLTSQPKKLLVLPSLLFLVLANNRINKKRCQKKIVLYSNQNETKINLSICYQKNHKPTRKSCNFSVDLLHKNYTSCWTWIPFACKNKIKALEKMLEKNYFSFK